MILITTDGSERSTTVIAHAAELSRACGKSICTMPVAPALREELEGAKKNALDIHAVIQDWSGPFELPAADEEAVNQTRQLVELGRRTVADHTERAEHQNRCRL